MLDDNHIDPSLNTWKASVHATKITVAWSQIWSVSFVLYIDYMPPTRFQLIEFCSESKINQRHESGHPPLVIITEQMHCENIIGINTITYQIICDLTQTAKTFVASLEFREAFYIERNIWTIINNSDFITRPLYIVVNWKMHKTFDRKYLS